MERLTKVHEMIDTYGLNDMTVLDELLRWLSNDEVNAFIQDFRDGWDLDCIQDGE